MELSFKQDGRKVLLVPTAVQNLPPKIHDFTPILMITYYSLNGCGILCARMPLAAPCSEKCINIMNMIHPFTVSTLITGKEQRILHA